MDNPTINIEQVDSNGIVIEKTPIKLIKDDNGKTVTKLFIETDSGVVGCLKLEMDESGVKNIALENYK